METAKKLPDKVQDALRRGLTKRLPLTFLPFVNQQLREWEFLFPNERRSTERLIVYVDGLSADESAALFRNVVRLEDEMGVRHWRFSTDEQTIQNSSELARSPYFQQWRQAVQAVFEAADRYAEQSDAISVKPRNRAIVLDIPASLPVQESDAWRLWHGLGKTLKLNTISSESSQIALDGMLAGLAASAAHGGGSSSIRENEESTADSWVIDGANTLVDAYLADKRSAALARAVLLSYSRLDAYRENFSRELNTMRKNLSDADSVYDYLRKVNVAPWCPAEVAADPAVREFVRAVYLNGNGAVIFGNSFVEWAASEALRRARPRFLAARFSMRSKPKPFTSVAVFENPNQINPLPAVDDDPGSALDAVVLAAYVWLSATRFEEYKRSTVCVCIARSLAEAYLVAPPEFELKGVNQPMPVEAIMDSLRLWLS